MVKIKATNLKLQPAERIGLEQFAGVSPVIAVVASFPQQTENQTFCPVL